MAVDQSPVPEGRKGGIPLWVILAGGGAVAILIWWRSRQSAASTTSPLVPAVATDPNTGLPIDPLTGLPYITNPGTATQTIAQWALSAYNALLAKGYSPALANQAIYDFTNGNPLTDAEAGAVNAALGQAGYPPIPLPFNGNLPVTPGNSPGSPSTASEQTSINALNDLLGAIGAPGKPAATTATIQAQITQIINRLAHTPGVPHGSLDHLGSQSIDAQLATLLNIVAHLPSTSRLPTAYQAYTHPKTPVKTSAKPAVVPGLGRPLTAAEARWITAYTRSH